MRHSPPCRLRREYLQYAAIEGYDAARRAILFHMAIVAMVLEHIVLDWRKLELVVIIID